VTAPRGTDLPSAPGTHAEQVAAIREKLATGEYKGRTRPLAEIEGKLDVVGTTLRGAIEEQLAARRPLAVLEIGFGWGPALIELAWRFRDEPVSFAGINLERKPPVERPEDLAAIAEALEIVPAERIGDFHPPDVHFYDATSLQFADDSLDLVYSAVTFRFIPDKVRAVEEVARVLRPGGRAILDLGERDWEYPGGPASDPVLLTEHPSYLVLHHRLELVPLADWFAFAGGERFTIRMSPGRRCVIDLTKRPARSTPGSASTPSARSRCASSRCRPAASTRATASCAAPTRLRRSAWPSSPRRRARG
jgi:SAM-dependent methyltransferase